MNEDNEKKEAFCPICQDLIKGKENAELKDLLEQLSDKARELAGKAEWCDSMHSLTLHEYYRYAHRCVLDLIDAVREECKTLDDVDELIDQMQYDCLSDYKSFQYHHFEHFAELAMVKFKVLGSVSWDIERNK